MLILLILLPGSAAGTYIALIYNSLKKVYLTSLGFFLVNFIPVLSFADENSKGVDMNTYGNWSGYTFIVIIALFITFFLRAALRNEVYIFHPIDESPAKLSTSENLNSHEILSQLNKLRYVIISLILIYAIIFVLLIT